MTGDTINENVLTSHALQANGKQAADNTVPDSAMADAGGVDDRACRM